MVERLNIVNAAAFPKLTYRFNEVIIKISERIFVEEYLYNCQTDFKN